MTREEHLVFCNKCNLRTMHFQQGLICSLTGKKASFQGVCPDYIIDERIKDEAVKNIKSIKPNLKRAKLAENLIWAVMTLDVISIWSSYLQYDLLKDLQNDVYIRDEILTANDSREQIIAFVYVVVYIVSCVTFIMWFRRAYYNLNIRVKCEHSEGWAAGSWFVPIISLFRPYQIMKEMWEESTRLIKVKLGSYSDDFSISIIGWWWGFWIVSHYIGKYSMKVGFNADTIEGLLNSTIADLVLSVLGIPLAILAVNIIKAYSLKEEKIVELEKSEINHYSS